MTTAATPMAIASISSAVRSAVAARRADGEGAAGQACASAARRPALVVPDGAVFHREAAARARAERRVVRDHDQRHAAGVELLEQAHHLVAGGTVEVAGGLVGQEQRRLHDGGARDRHALALAAGQLVGPVLGAVGQAVVRRAPAHALRRARAPAMPASIIGSAMFSAAVRRGTRWKLWNTKPMRWLRTRACSSGDSVVTSRPSSR